MTSGCITNVFTTMLTEKWSGRGTHKGLFLREPLNRMKDYKYDDRLRRMMDKMRKKAPLDPNDEYYFR